MVRTLGILLAIVALAAAAAWWWWTAPAGAPTVELATALGQAAAHGEGAVVIAQPSRAGRWLIRHREAGVLLAAAAPGALRTGRRMAIPARVLAQAAEGPLRVWWRGSELALAAPVDAGARQGLTEMAALRGLAAAEVGGAFAVASDSDLLVEPATATPPIRLPATAPSDATAVAWTGSRIWWVTARGGRLVAAAGDPTDPPPEAGPQEAAFTAAAPLLAAAGLDRLGLGDRITLIFADDDGWGVWLGGARLSGEVRRLLGGRGDVAGGAHRTRGPFGEVWWRADDGVAVSTDEALLSALADVAPGDHGRLQGAPLATSLERLSRMLEPLPGLASRASALRTAAASVHDLASVRWRVAPEGGIIVMEW